MCGKEIFYCAPQHNMAIGGAVASNIQCNVFFLLFPFNQVKEIYIYIKERAKALVHREYIEKCNCKERRTKKSRRENRLQKLSGSPKQKESQKSVSLKNEQNPPHYQRSSYFFLLPKKLWAEHASKFP
ncbi:hypothetical protein L1049_021753 [Liquidambar formosana]|uniref:Uncharacterized protein n=1 Tax=Liquidambar formosana TaxID=63359 RepID=A0AAP0RBD4_LIQFO